MKIVHISDCFAPRLGGIERQIADLAARQSEAGHTVEIITSVPGPGRHGDVIVHRPRSAAARGTSTGIRYTAAQRGPRLLREHAYDVAHVHLSCWSPLAALSAREASRIGLPTVVTVHSMWTTARLPLQASAGLFGFRGWQAIWSAVSLPAAASIQDAAGTADIAVLPNGIDPSFWALSPRAAADPSRVRVVSVMRLSRRKRPEALLRVLARVRATIPADLRLEATIIGDGPQRDALHARAAALGISNWLAFTGSLDRAEIRNMFAGADLYVAPARLESFGIAALEARSAGLPVVGYRGTGLTDYVHDGTHGLLVDDDAGLVAAIRQLVLDPALRQSIGQQNQREAPPATWPQVLSGCIALYERAAVLVSGTKLVEASPVELIDEVVAG